MTIRFLQPFLQQYSNLPNAIQKKVDRQVQFLSQDLRHPGIHAKKMTSVGDIWEARIDRQYRMTFKIEGDTLVFRRAGTHDVLKNP